MSGSTFLTYTFENEKKEAAWLKLGNGMRLYVSVPEKENLRIRGIYIPINKER